MIDYLKILSNYTCMHAGIKFKFCLSDCILLLFNSSNSNNNMMK